jgi:Mn2+/Fe2+ NRAMP family transporter
MNITAIFVVGFVILGIYKLFELYAKRDERKSIIEKLPVFLENKDLKEPIILPDILYKRPAYGSWALRIALLLMGIGIGCAIAFCFQYSLFGDLNYNVKDWEIRRQINDTQEIIYFAFISTFGGIGMLVAYLIERKEAKK